MSDRQVGVFMVMSAGLLYSTAGLFTIALKVDAWTVLAWRAVFGTAFMAAWMLTRERRRIVQSLRLPVGTVVFAIPMALSNACYIAALKFATVADVTVISATLPFVTAIVAWLWVGAVPDRRLIIASSVALCGVALTATSSIGDLDRLLGMLLALGMNLGMAIALVHAGRDPRSADAVYTLGTMLSGLLGFGLAPLTMVSANELLLLALFGVTTIGLAMALYLAGARRIPAAEVGLISMLDVPAGPLLVWWVFGQVPSLQTAIGGTIVLAALLWHVAPNVRTTRRRAARSSV